MCFANPSCFTCAHWFGVRLSRCEWCVARDYCRVRVPFGARKLVGIVVAHIEHSQLYANAIKPVLDILDERPIVDEALLKTRLLAVCLLLLSAWWCVFCHLPTWIFAKEWRSTIDNYVGNNYVMPLDDDFSASAKSNANNLLYVNWSSTRMAIHIAMPQNL